MKSVMLNAFPFRHTGRHGNHFFTILCSGLLGNLDVLNTFSAYHVGACSALKWDLSLSSPDATLLAANTITPTGASDVVLHRDPIHLAES